MDVMVKDIRSEKINEFWNSLDISASTETKKMGTGIEEKGEQIYSYSGVDKNKGVTAGVSIAINKKYKRDIKIENNNIEVKQY